MSTEAKYDVLYERVSALRKLCASCNKVTPEQLVESLEKVLRQVGSCDPKWRVYLERRANRTTSTAKDPVLASDSAARSSSDPVPTDSSSRPVDERAARKPDARRVSFNDKEFLFECESGVKPTPSASRQRATAFKPRKQASVEFSPEAKDANVLPNPHTLTPST